MEELGRKKFKYHYELLFNMSEKGNPKRDGSGRGLRGNQGRGGCEETESSGKGKRSFGFGRRRPRRNRP